MGGSGQEADGALFSWRERYEKQSGNFSAQSRHSSKTEDEFALLTKRAVAWGLQVAWGQRAGIMETTAGSVKGQWRKWKQRQLQSKEQLALCLYSI